MSKGDIENDTSLKETLNKNKTLDSNNQVKRNRKAKNQKVKIKSRTDAMKLSKKGSTYFQLTKICFSQPLQSVALSNYPTWIRKRRKRKKFCSLQA